MSTDPMGKSPGQPTDLSSMGLSNSYTDIPDISVDAIADRVLPRQTASGITRGAQATAGADGNPQVLVGNQQTFGNGFYVAKPAINVITNTDPNQMIFNSNQNTFKIATIVTGTYLVDATDASNAYANFSFPHSLTIRPTVLGSFYRSSDSLTRQLPFNFRSPTQSYYTTSAPGGLSHTSSASVDIYNIDDTNINLQIKIFDINGLSWLLAGVSFVFKFYCLQETVIAA